MLNVCIAADHRPAQVQEMTAGTERSSLFCLGPQNLLAKQSKNTESQERVLAGCFLMECEKLVVLGIV